MSKTSAANQARRQYTVSQKRDSQGHFIKSAETAPAPPKEFFSLPKSSFFSFRPNINATSNTSKETTTDKNIPPLLSLKITNPIVYIKAWWKKVIANEGVDFRFRIHPLTAIVLTVIVAGLAFGLGRFSLPADSPIIKYVPQLAPTPTPDPWKEAAYTGILRYTDSGKKFYLETPDSGVITLDVPAQVNMAKLVSKRILAVGKYNTQTGILAVTEASDLEILPTQIVPVPLISTTN